MKIQEVSNVVSGSIPFDELSGGIDLYRTLASGQTYRWRREDGHLFEPPTSLPTPWYETVAEGAVIRVRQEETSLHWQGSRDIEEHVRHMLRLEDNLPNILEQGPTDDIYQEAIEAHRGMRLVVDSLYIGLISFICSTQMHVERIHKMVQTLMREVGTPIKLDGRTYYAFPTPEQLAACSEAELRACGLGYRAPYVRETAQALACDEAPLPSTPHTEYEQLREQLTIYPGVGPKVADCALLFGMGCLEPVPLDRWIQRAIRDHFPSCDRDSYAETSRAIRSYLGPYPGYAQTYLFHHLRTS